MQFDAESLEIAGRVFDAIVGNDKPRALALEPVIRWHLKAWVAFEDTIASAGFNIRNPDHLAALQYLIDKACDL